MGFGGDDGCGYGGLSCRMLVWGYPMNQINEAPPHRVMGGEVILDRGDFERLVTRAYVRDWITCPTCGGSGIVAAGHPEPHRTTASCPDCVDGMIPDPELRDRGAKAAAVELRRLNRQAVGGFDVESIDPVSRLIADAVLLASRRGETRA